MTRHPSWICLRQPVAGLQTSTQGGRYGNVLQATSSHRRRCYCTKQGSLRLALKKIQCHNRSALPLLRQGYRYNKTPTPSELALVTALIYQHLEVGPNMLHFDLWAWDLCADYQWAALETTIIIPEVPCRLSDVHHGSCSCPPHRLHLS